MNIKHVFPPLETLTLKKQEMIIAENQFKKVLEFFFSNQPNLLPMIRNRFCKVSVDNIRMQQLHSVDVTSK